MFCWLSGSVLFSWVCVLVLSHVHLFATPWTVARQSPLSMKLPSQEYCSGLPFLSGLHCGSHGKEFCLQCRRPRYDPWVGKIPWRREWQFTPVFLPGESHRQRRLEGYSLSVHKESNTTKLYIFALFSPIVTTNKSNRNWIPKKYFK